MNDDDAEAAQQASRQITRQTRAEAYQAVLPLAQNRMERAADALRPRHAGLTAGEVAEATGLPLNGARSALTELLNVNRVSAPRKRKSTHPGASKLRVAVWVLNKEAA